MKAQDPVLRFSKTLVEQGVLDDRIEEEMQAKAKTVVEDAVEHAEAAPYPSVEEARYPVYAEEAREVIHG